MTAAEIQAVAIRVGALSGTQYVVPSGFAFSSQEAAAEFLNSAWPRQLEDGRYVTSDRRIFPAHRAAWAKARQKNLGGGN